MASGVPDALLAQSKTCTWTVQLHLYVYQQLLHTACMTGACQNARKVTICRAQTQQLTLTQSEQIAELCAV